MPSLKRDIFVSVQNSIRFDRFRFGAHKYLLFPEQFFLLAAVLNSDAFIGHLSTGFTLNRYGKIYFKKKTKTKSIKAMFFKLKVIDPFFIILNKKTF